MILPTGEIRLILLVCGYYIMTTHKKLLNICLVSSDERELENIMNEQSPHILNIIPRMFIYSAVGSSVAEDLIRPSGVFFCRRIRTTSSRHVENQRGTSQQALGGKFNMVNGSSGYEQTWLT
ncbi:hypothetical protein pdam_00006116 [Pocillopora damicornis]|uniref:Uncharacterized protein n=1 Tax=Pocillopora damicornis TaxID=46731 RepID=A0A3M6TE05_POCDA|nr:hypothetical protein pdam_00006116 [Pocillopora damicornis]